MQPTGRFRRRSLSSLAYERKSAIYSTTLGRDSSRDLEHLHRFDYLGWLFRFTASFISPIFCIFCFGRCADCHRLDFPQIGTRHFVAGIFAAIYSILPVWSWRIMVDERGYRCRCHSRGHPSQEYFVLSHAPSEKSPELLESMDGLSHTTIIELAESLAGWRGSCHLWIVSHHTHLNSAIPETVAPEFTSLTSALPHRIYEHTSIQHRSNRTNTD